MSAPTTSEWVNDQWRNLLRWLASTSPFHQRAPTTPEELADRAALLGPGPERTAEELRAAHGRAVGRDLLARQRARAEARKGRFVDFPMPGGSVRRVPVVVVEVVEALAVAPQSQKALAAKLGRSASTVSRALAKAEKLGRATRPADPAKGLWRIAEPRPFFAPRARAQDRLSAAIAALGPDATAAEIARHAGISERHVRRLRNGR